ncbi:putative ABSCISIC ACID-INSENSITIVE 5-like protein 7-like isoform X3 [Capsicum annuum]|nr:putative ABSCISIC ACID-INSENSITIVE 5-like protein 7-like isoform X3 [Capsicum annuum]
MKIWSKSSNPSSLPPTIKYLSSRSGKSRRNEQSKNKAGKLSKYDVEMSYSKGHNKRGCHLATSSTKSSVGSSATPSTKRGRRRPKRSTKRAGATAATANRKRGAAASGRGRGVATTATMDGIGNKKDLFCCHYRGIGRERKATPSTTDGNDRGREAAISTVIGIDRGKGRGASTNKVREVDGFTGVGRVRGAYFKRRRIVGMEVLQTESGYKILNRESTLGEMTLEEFLVRAGVVREDMQRTGYSNDVTFTTSGFTQPSSNLTIVFQQATQSPGHQIAGNNIFNVVSTTSSLLQPLFPKQTTVEFASTMQLGTRAPMPNSSVNTNSTMWGGVMNVSIKEGSPGNLDASSLSPSSYA